MKVKVLLVDDEEEFVEILGQRLETRGIEVRKAFTGENAVEQIRQEDLDVVILDVVMPGKSGIDTLQEVKSIKPLTEVIMLTGHAEVQTAIDGMKLGAYDYLMKPIEISELVEKITKAHGRKTGQEERIRQAEINEILKRRGW